MKEILSCSIKRKMRACLSDIGLGLFGLAQFPLSQLSPSPQFSHVTVASQQRYSFNFKLLASRTIGSH